MNQKNKTPAILGGKKAFSRVLPLTRPALAPWSKVSPPLREIIENGYLTKGRYLKEFEKKVSQYLGVKYAVATSSCTTGLVLTLLALDLKGEVILPSFTFMATGLAVLWNNLTPVFADILPDTLNIDPEDVTGKITNKTVAILVPHIFGNPADIKGLEKIAQKHGLKLIFDAAHGFGALYQGQPVGAFGDAEIFSTSPTKLLVTGEGGVVATNNFEIAKKVALGREYGNPGNYDCVLLGLNARMQEFSAILGLANLKILKPGAQKRNQLARLFMKNLKDIPGVSFQKIEPGSRSSYKDFTLLIDQELAGLDRDQLAQALAAENIETRNYYDPALHQTKLFQKFNRGLKLLGTEKAAREAISLPLGSQMTEEDVFKVCRTIKNILKHRPQIKKLFS